ncbi:MAG: hypothetical protein FJ125_07360 [Deltaproteobacteria bacterium]|nr:hypothetical protein [Deltaproteobacteria bacterium]
MSTRNTAIFMLALAAALVACGDGGEEEGGGTRTFQGTILGLGSSGLTFAGLQLALVCGDKLIHNGQPLYDSNQVYRSQEIGEDHRFSFVLPEDVEDAWVGPHPFDGSSAHFYPVAFNDANANGKLDCSTEALYRCRDPIAPLFEAGQTITLVYIRDAARVYGAPPELAKGWAIVTEVKSFGHDFGRDHDLEAKTMQ